VLNGAYRRGAVGAPVFVEVVGLIDEAPQAVLQGLNVPLVS